MFIDVRGVQSAVYWNLSNLTQALAATKCSKKKQHIPGGFSEQQDPYQLNSLVNVASVILAILKTEKMRPTGPLKEQIFWDAS